MDEITIKTDFSSTTQSDLMKGIVLPSAQPEEVDRLRSLRVHAQKKNILLALERLGANKTVSDSIRASANHLKASLEALPAASLMSLRLPPVISTYHGWDQIRVAEAEQLLQFYGVLIGTPGALPFSTVIPTQAFVDDCLFMPSLGAFLFNHGGPVAVETDDNQIAFTWFDGVQVTVPNRELCNSGIADGRLIALPKVEQYTLINAAPGLHHIDQAEWSIPGERLAKLHQGCNILAACWPDSYAACQRTYRAIFVLKHSHDHFFSFTDGDCPDVFYSSLRDPMQIADTIVHESAHARLALLLHKDPLLQDSPQELHDSPWRKDKRPMTGILNGVHAFANVILFYKRALEVYPEIEPGVVPFLETQIGHVKAAWGYMEEKSNPTELGRQFFDGLQRLVESL